MDKQAPNREAMEKSGVTFCAMPPEMRAALAAKATIG